jgi:putative heme-binding domain-containing protein
LYGRNTEIFLTSPHRSGSLFHAFFSTLILFSTFECCEPCRGADDRPAAAIPPGGTASVPKARPYDKALVDRVAADARLHGHAERGAAVFMSARFACVSCHKVGTLGGTVGPDLTFVGRCLPPGEIVESVLWPQRKIKEGYVAQRVLTTTGKLHTGYKTRENDKELVLRDPATESTFRLAKSEIDERYEIGSLMPNGLADSMSADELRDLIRFLFDLGTAGGSSPSSLIAHAGVPATFPIERGPLHPERWPSWQAYVNRDRVYDFYAKEAEYFKTHPGSLLLPEFPGLDGGKYGHWGNQNEATWADDRWSQTDLGSVLSGVFACPGVLVPRGVCVRLGEHGELAACFNPDTLSYDAVWQGGFLKLSSVRHGFLDGLAPDGRLLERPAGTKPDSPFTYHGFYRHGKRVIFSYRIGEQEILDAPWVEGNKFTRLVGPARSHPLASLTHGGPGQWPQVFETRATLGKGGAYVIDTIEPPFSNPWKAPLFFGDHDFLPDGTAFLCTMQGDVWRVEGLDHELKHVRWRRIASGLHQALGLVVAQGAIYVLGRDQITRLHDLNGDGEADFYECFSKSYLTSPLGHDYVCGLQRDGAGRFYTASSKQGVLRVSADGQRAEVLATGFRNPDGLGLLPEGAVTVPCSEGDWTPASMICMVKPTQPRPETAARTGPVPSGQSGTWGSHLLHYGYGGPQGGRPPELPFVYLPRGLDNSSGAQVFVTGERFGPLSGQLLHFSYGAASHFLVLWEEVDGHPQGAAVPLPGEFQSGAHRGKINPRDGQLYVSGMAGWGTYSVADGSFERVRYTGAPAQLPTAFHVHENGVRITFTLPLDRRLAADRKNHFVQAWNYRYGPAYGSPEFSPRHPGTPGHDPLTVAGSHVLGDARTLFLELPELQPVNQLHLHLRTGAGEAQEIFATAHRLGPPFTEFPGYRAAAKQIAAHPILTDLALRAERVPNPWRRKLAGAREITLAAGKNLSFDTRELTARRGEPLRLTLVNPDVVPHNWLLVRPGSLERVGTLANKLVAEPDAAARQYVPRSDDILAYTDVVGPGESFAISFRAPSQPGRYPFLCAFPGHWMVMNGQMIVK